MARFLKAFKPNRWPVVAKVPAATSAHRVGTPLVPLGLRTQPRAFPKPGYRIALNHHGAHSPKPTLMPSKIDPGYSGVGQRSRIGIWRCRCGQRPPATAQCLNQLHPRNDTAGKCVAGALFGVEQSGLRDDYFQISVQTVGVTVIGVLQLFLCRFHCCLLRNRLLIDVVYRCQRVFDIAVG